ncbi:Cmx/CmrA family chloramphenicol efflux MFS transporter [Nocardia sp. NPDC056100]|uniref:Cmx/CmrA family chloramphenicol efflux MFS transporter n=1 Tax=Nocardia sp. NPDC056100 TaxID=3345712 RepID=UPI0035DC9658
MPVAIYVLGFAIFAQGTSEFMLSGLLPEMAHDLNVSIPDAGLLISAYAIGMVIGAPLLAMATLRWPKRRALLSFLAVFIAAHMVGAVATGYPLLFTTRVIGAIACAGFFGVAAVTAVDLVGAHRAGRALSIVIGGITVSTVLGVPLGTVIGQQLGWRSAFWTVAALAAVAAAGVAVSVRTAPRRPGDETPRAVPRFTDELRSLADPGLWIVYGTSALIFSSMMASFSYLGAMLTTDTGLDASWVPVVLALFGVGSLIGIIVGGRVADAHPFPTLYLGASGVLLSCIGIAAFASHPIPVIVLVFLMGLFGLATNPAINVRVYAHLGQVRTLGGALVTSAFNVGNTLAPWLAGLAVAAGLGYRSTAWVGAGMCTLGLLTVAAGHLRNRRRTPVPPVSAEPVLVG